MGLQKNGFRRRSRRQDDGGSGVGWLDQIVATGHAAALGFLEGSGGGNGAENVKQRSVGRDLEIEIHKAVHQDADTSEESGDGQSAAGGFSPVVYFGGGMTEDEHQKPDRDGESGETGFDQQLQIIVMSLVHEERGVETAKFRIDDRKSAESPAEHRPLEQHAQAVAVDGEADASTDFFTSFGVNAGQALGEFVAAHPNEKDNHRRQKRAQH